MHKIDILTKKIISLSKPSLKNFRIVRLVFSLDYVHKAVISCASSRSSRYLYYYLACYLNRHFVNRTVFLSSPGPTNIQTQCY